MHEINDMEIAPDFRVSDWKKLELKTPDSDDWEKAVGVFKERIISRFIEPADILIAAYENDKARVVGFAVLALDFIVIETLQGFIEGKLDRNKPTDVFKRFLTSDPEFKEIIHSKGFAGCLYGAFRCGISHQGQTDGNFRVRADGDMIQRHGNGPKYDITINRTEFHEAVKRSFEKYCQRLSDPKEETLRDNLLKKMNAIYGI